MKPSDVVNQIVADAHPDAIESAHMLIRLECHDHLDPLTRLAFVIISPGDEFAFNWHIKAIT